LVSGFLSDLDWFLSDLDRLGFSFGFGFSGFSVGFRIRDFFVRVNNTKMVRNKTFS
jgi:hypothetical protein